MNKIISRYYQLKNKQKQIEQELSELKAAIVEHLQSIEAKELRSGSYQVRLVSSLRKEYNDVLLYNALPDPQLWRMVSKPDHSKIAGLLKINALSEEQLKHTFTMKEQLALYVDKQ